MKRFIASLLVIMLFGTQVHASFVRAEWVDVERQQALRFQASTIASVAEKVSSVTPLRSSRPIASEHGLWGTTLTTEAINLGDITSADNKSLLNANAISAALAELYLQGLSIGDFSALQFPLFTFNTAVNTGQLQPVTVNAVTNSVPLPSAILLFLSGIGLVIARVKR